MSTAQARKRGISPGLARQAGRALNAARARRALTSDKRVAFWAEQVIAASGDAEAREVIGTINSLAGLDGPGPGDGDDDPGEFLHLFPPQPGRQREWQASMLAASAPAPDDDDGEDEEFLHLYPPRPGQEHQWQAARAAADREATAAAALRQAEEDELFASLFGEGES